MAIAEQFIKDHNNANLYLKENKKVGYTSFSNCCGWKDYILEKNLIYSHRINEYTKKTFSEQLHVHEYYELVVYVSGNVEYRTDTHIIKPRPYSVIWFLPGQMHTATLLSASKYERYVFYFSKDFFTMNDTEIPMMDFMNDKNKNAFNFDSTFVGEIKCILEKIEAELKTNRPYSGLLVKALITQMFALFNNPDVCIEKCSLFTDILMQIKNYIDNEYASITTSADISENFHYSREHISREFKDKFNISLSKYIAKRRIIESLPLLNEMSIAEAAYTVGFRSQSSYISSFVDNMGCLPSKYKKQKQT